jgi:hypothetical protein
MIYSVPYIVLGVYIAITHLLQNSLIKSKRFIVDGLLYMAIIFFFCFRGYVGRDWYNYYNLYTSIPDLNHGLVSNIGSVFFLGVEPLFCLYLGITKSIFFDYLVWLNFNTAVDILLITIVIKYFNVKNKSLFYLLFCAFGGISFEIDALRNAKGIYIFLISLRFLKEKKFVSYLLLNILGCLFHISSLMYVPFYFIANKKYNRVFIMILFILGYIILIGKINIFSSILTIFLERDFGRISALIRIYSVTSNEVRSYSGGIFGITERFITFVILFTNEKRLYKIMRHRIFINALYIYLLIFLYCSGIGILAERLPLLFIFSYWFIYLEMYNITRQKGIILFFLIIYTILKFLSAWSNPLSLYENVLIKHMTVTERNIYVQNNTK